VHHTTINGVEYNVEASKNLLKQFKETAPRAKPAPPKQKAVESSAAHSAESSRRAHMQQDGQGGAMRAAMPPSQMPTHGAQQVQQARGGGQLAKPRGTHADAGAVGPGGMLPRNVPAAPMLTTGQLRGPQPYPQTGYSNMPQPQYMPYAPQSTPYDGGQYGYGPVHGQGPYGHPVPMSMPTNGAHYHPGAQGPMPVRNAVHLTGHNGMPQQMRSPHGGPMAAPYWAPAQHGAYMPYEQPAVHPQMQVHHYRATRYASVWYS
jgi:hypothetical protein